VQVFSCLFLWKSHVSTILKRIQHCSHFTFPTKIHLNLFNWYLPINNRSYFRFVVPRDQWLKHTQCAKWLPNFSQALIIIQMGNSPPVFQLEMYFGSAPKMMKPCIPIPIPIPIYQTPITDPSPWALCTNTQQFAIYPLWALNPSSIEFNRRWLTEALLSLPLFAFLSLLLGGGRWKSWIFQEHQPNRKTEDE